MKVNANDTGSLSEKSFAKYSFDSEKKLWCQKGLTKAFRFSSPLFKEAIEVLEFYISEGSNSM